MPNLMNNIIKQIYFILLELYGFQGWWPLIDYKTTNATKRGLINGYHPKDYSFPKTENQHFEICVGAILTQNTGWTAVDKALRNLNKAQALNAKKIKHMHIMTLKKAIKPAGYFNQKAKKLKIFAEFYTLLKARTPTRKELLSVWGIGPETADSILLYAYAVPTFVVDSYTRRIFSNLGLIKRNSKYDEIKQLFESNLKPDFKTYQEYHALIVEHGKRYYSKKLEYQKCPIYKKLGKMQLSGE